jgi:WD40 repeat protein
VAWDHKILSFEKNKWIINNFSHVKKITGLEEPPHLVTGSSDSWVKLWKWEGSRLTELHRLRAHQKAIREVQWRPNYLFDSERFIITCSEVIVFS